MAPNAKIPAGPIHKYLAREDLEKFRTNLVKTREMTELIVAAFQQFNAQIHMLKTTGPTAAAVDPLRREIRQCQEVVDSAMFSARSQEKISATLLEEGRTGDTLTAINEGLSAIGGLTVPFVKLRGSLDDICTKPVVNDRLEALGFDKEIAAWKASLDEWTLKTNVASWRVSELSS